MLILKYSKMFRTLWMLLLLSLLTLEGPLPTEALLANMGYKTQSNGELLEIDSRYISYQGRWRWGLSKTIRKVCQLQGNQSRRAT